VLGVSEAARLFRELQSVAWHGMAPRIARVLPSEPQETLDPENQSMGDTKEGYCAWQALVGIVLCIAPHTLSPHQNSFGCDELVSGNSGESMQ
jgi:hypothetical protein